MKEIRTEDIFNISMEEFDARIEKIVAKVSTDGNVGVRKTKWKDKDFVKGILTEYIEYMTIERNSFIEDEESMFKVSDALDHLEKNFNFKNKPSVKKLKDNFKILDNNTSRDNANQIVKGFGKILCDSETTLTKKMKILNHFDFVPSVIKDPKRLISSPERIYSHLSYFNDMVSEGKEERALNDIPISTIFGDKDPYNINSGNIMERIDEEGLASRYQIPNEF